MSLVEAQDRLMLIDGRMVESSDGRWLESIDPANEQPLGRVPIAGPEDVERAVRAGERAQPEWAALPTAERARILRQIGPRLLERSDEILTLEVRDTGNTVKKMRGDLSAAVALLDYYAGLAAEIKGDTLPIAGDMLHMSLRNPYGVVARIVPFNHPMYFAVAALAGPLMAGNAVIVKPPETSPLSSAILGEVCRELLPSGLVSILPGPGLVTGDAIVRHPRVRRIAFTGSVPTGLAIQRAAAERYVKNVSLELGGKNPMIVFPDVDPDQAAAAAVAGMNFAWQGQSCGSTSRLMLHESIYDAVVERLVAQVKAIQLGDPLDDASQMGPINSRGHYERVLRYVAVGREDGAKLAAGGRRPTGSAFERGFWIEPTVFVDATMDMRVASEEIFGPILSVLKWRNIHEAVALANATEYGLTTAIWTNDIREALRLARRVDCGYVWINGPGAHYPGIPFGGTKNSGVGREECLEELLSYTQLKSISVSLR